MTFPELDKKLENVINDAKTHYHGDLMANVGMHARKLIFDRVTKTGVDAKGSKFRDYSRKDMLIGKKSARTKEVAELLFGNKKKRAAMDWVTLGGNRYAQYLSESAGTSTGLVRLAILKGGYRKLRQLWGLQVKFVDFTVTGRMWNNINLISSSTDHQKGVAIIGARGDDNKKKLAGNTKSRGDILDLRSSEIDLLMKEYSLDFLQVIRNEGL